MSDQEDLDPIDALRAANPVDADLLSSARLAAIRARVQENTMHKTEPRAQRRPLLLLPLVAAIAIAAFVMISAGGPGGLLPGSSPGASVAIVSPGASTTVGSASCVEPYSQAALVKRAFAFDGTVSAISGEEVTFTINRAYKGGTGSLTLTATGMTGTAITSAGGPNLSVGGRYLVAGEDHFAWACGYTQPYDQATATQWSSAFGG